MATDFDPELVPQDGNAATKVFKNFFVQLMEGIQDTDKLAVELYADDVIVRTTRDQVTQITLTREQKNTKLLAAVESQLHVSPKAFEVFLYALRERTTLNDICRRMEEAYRQPSAVYARSTSETDSFGQNQVQPPAFESEPFTENVTTSVSPSHASRVHVFPYLNMGEMNEQQKLVLQGKLLEDSDNIMAEFSDVIHYTIVSLKANPDVSVEILSTRVASLGAYRPVHAQKLLLRDQLREIRACSTIDGVFFILQEYYSFFNYGIIQRIVIWFGTPADERRLEEYIEHFKEFCKRRTFECPPDIFGHTSDDKSALVVKTEDSWDPCEETQGKILEQVVRLRTTLAKVLEVECETLYLCRIDKGCVELKFQVPSFIQRDIFPLSREQERSLIKIGVASLICGSYTFAQQVLTVGEDSNGNDSSDGEVNRQQENSDSDIKSKRTLRKEWLLASDLALEEALKNVGGEEDSSDGEVDGQQENDDSDIESEKTLMSQRLYPHASSYNRQERLPAVHEARTPSEMPSIKTIIEDDRLFLKFRRFLKDQCITRNLNFWLACEHFRQLPCRDNQEHLNEVGRAIYSKFIKQSAAQHVTILDRTKRNIKMSLELRSQVTPQLFGTAQQEIYEVMEKNEFRQFLVSDVFPDCMVNPVYSVSGGESLQQSRVETSSYISSLAMREVQDALKDLDMMKHVNKKSWSHKSTGSTYSSSVLSTTSDSGVGSSVLSTTSDSGVDQLDWVKLLQAMPPPVNRDRQAQAAALALISNSPQPDQLDWVTQSMPPPVNRERHRTRQAHHFGNYPQAYSSDDSLSCFTITSQSSTSDVFIPSRLPPQFHSNSDSDAPHHLSHGRHYPPRRPTSLKHSHLVHTHKPSPPSIAEHGMTPQRQSEDILVVYHLDDFPTPYAKRIRGVEITLAEFKEKVFTRKGDYRYFFKSIRKDLGTEIMEEYSDDAAVLPHTQGKIMGHVKRVT